MPLAMRARSALLGHDRSQAKRMVGVALIVAIGIWSIGALVRMRRWFPEAFQHAHPLAVVVSLGVVGGVLAAVTAYRNDGLLVGWFSCSRLRPRGSGCTTLLQPSLFRCSALWPLSRGWQLLSSRRLDT